MSYSVRLDDTAMAKMVGWGLPRAGMKAILDRMDDLREFPSRHLLRVTTSEHILECDVVYRDQGPPERDCLVVLSVRYGIDEETLKIVDCRRVFDDELA